ncbi:hypothetical protein CesoFtcFv8_007641 [Champsocephalus esox]|uniref:Uncharacterized protein n=1 Tax=Champsocephalus esox TaxID=159716 RepID=A0AAN8CER7_9TELE|nr:hypothetical protein CesoFtcFv8_007641 [Champsocephalus esox]
MAQRHRALPTWMSKKEEKVKENEPLKSKRKRKTARAVFYCMNEQELVEAAVSYFTNGACDDGALPTDQKVEDKEVDTTVKMRKSPAILKTTVKPVIIEESSDSGDALDSTYVSETDMDITEVETLPYTKGEQHQGAEGQRSGPVQDHSIPVNVELDTEEKEKHSQVLAEVAEEDEEEEEDEDDDDALRLVRDIFFT